MTDSAMQPPKTPYLDRAATRSYMLIVARTNNREAHDAIDQKRKYTGEPYWFHTESVAEILAALGLRDEVLAAAVSHDIDEDVTPLKPEYGIKVTKLLGHEVKRLVTEVTDVFTKEKFPDLNRAQRKAREAERLSLISVEGRLIKLADMIDNGATIASSDPDFAKTYLEEKRAIIAKFQRSKEQLEEEMSVERISDEAYRSTLRHAYFALLEKASLL